MIINMSNGDSFIISFWTKWNTGKKDFEKKDLHFVVKDNHLFICDNAWRKLLIKDVNYPTRKGSMANTHKGLEQELLAKKGKKYEKICIDLLSNEWCEYMKPHVASRRKKNRGKNE